jgi:SRSO17 transposase
VLAVARSHRIRTGTGTSRADALAAVLPKSAWQRYSAGPGAKGHRCYDWAWTSIEPRRRGCRWLLIRRSIATGELAFYRCYSPRPVPLAALAQVAGRRWAVEEDFQAAKGLAGLDEHQVRRWDSWYRWTTLAMLATAFLTITAAAEHARSPAPDSQVPLTRNEISRLLATLVIRPMHGIWHRLRWSAWRRRHQHRAQNCHYQRQARQL